MKSKARITSADRIHFIRENISALDASRKLHWKVRNKTPEAKKFIELARAKFNFSPKTSNQDIWNGFERIYDQLKHTNS